MDALAEEARNVVGDGDGEDTLLVVAVESEAANPRPPRR